MPDQNKTAAEILALQDTKVDVLYVPDWDTNVTVRGLTKRQQLDIKRRSTINGEIDEDQSQAFLWLEGVVEPVFTEDQLGALFEKAAAPVDLVLKRIMTLSGMMPEALKEKEARFPAGPGPSLPLRLSAVPAQDGSGVGVGASDADNN